MKLKKSFPLVSTLVVIVNLIVILMAVAGRTELAVGMGVMNIPVLIRAALLDYHYKKIQLDLIETLDKQMRALPEVSSFAGGFRMAFEIVKRILGYDDSRK